MCERYMIDCLLHALKLGAWPATQACALTGNRIVSLSIHSQSTESLYPGLEFLIEWLWSRGEKIKPRFFA